MKRAKGLTLVETLIIVIIIGILAAIIIPQFQNVTERQKQARAEATMSAANEIRASVVTAAEFFETSLKNPDNALLGMGQVDLAGATYHFFLVRDRGSGGSETQTLYFLTEGEVRELHKLTP